MSRTARLWKGAGPLTLGGLLLSGAMTQGAAPPPLSDQLLGLGRQALAQGHAAEAQGFYRQVLKLDPNNAEARRALAARPGGVRRVAMQEPTPDTEAPVIVPPGRTPGSLDPSQNVLGRPTDVNESPMSVDPPVPPANAVPPDPGAFPTDPMTDPGSDAVPPSAPARRATSERAGELERVFEQQLTSDINERLQRARELVNQGQPEAALETLRLAREAIRSSGEQVPAATRTALDRRVQVQYRSTVRRLEEIELSRADTLRQQAAAEQRDRALAALNTNEETANLLMIQFDRLMAEGQYNVMANGGLGDIGAATAPFYEARLVAQKARALEPIRTAPRAGVMVSQNIAFLAQALAFEELKEYRAMLTWQDVDRAAVPFPDTTTIEYPPAEDFRIITEKRRQRYETVDLSSDDEKTKSILRKLDQSIPIQFPEETPLEDALKYVKAATQGPNDSGIPIYVDPVGLQEAEKTMQSPIQLDLEGVPLKTTLRLMLKQLGLTYTVDKGLMTITAESSEDVPVKIRVYPVADLAIIPLSLMGGGGGGMGGMGGGMGGMGGGMGGMGGMGGGMGGMGGGMGMFSVPPQDPNADAGRAPGFMEKKSN